MENRAQSFDVCIVCALYEEAEAVLDEFSTRCHVSFLEEFSSMDRYEYRYTSILNNRGEPLTILVTWLSDSGPTQTGLDLKPFLHEFRPRFVAMTGFCAGYKKKVKWGDLVIAQYAYFYEAGKVIREAEGLSRHLQEMKAAASTSQILHYARGFDGWKEPVKKMKSDRLKRELKETEEPRCVIAPMASGMAVRQDDPFLWLREHYDRNTVGLDMEAATFYQALRAVSHIHGLVVKGVCDYANMNKKDTYHDYAARASAVYLLTFIQEYVTEQTMPRRDVPSPSRRAEQPSVSSTRMLGFLPLVETALVGRDRLLFLLKQQLKDPETGSPAVVLHGQPGVGKTTIAAQLARDEEIRATYSGGVLWADLGEKPSLSDILAVWASQLEADLSRATIIPEKVGCLQEKLGHAPFLLILDDLWLADLGALHPLLRMAGPGCALLITTRDQNVAEALGKLVGSKQILVDELDEEDALTLLMALCKDKLTDRRVFVPLAKAAGGLPLTLEVMGAYINSHLPVALDPLHIRQKLRRIENYLQLPEDAGPRRLPPQDVFDLSINNLPDQQTKRAFFALGAFAPKPATFSMEAMQFVTEADRETLQTLYNRHLLHQSSHDRYTLHQSLVGAARVHLRANDPAWLRHRIYYQKQIERAILVGQKEKDALTKIDWRALFSDLPQMRAIRLPQRPASTFSIMVNRHLGSLSWLRWLNQLPLWLKNGLSRILLTGLVLLTSGTHIIRQMHFEAALANYQGWLAAEVGDRGRALDHYKHAQELWTRLDNRPGLALVLNNLGKTYYMQADYLQALRAYHHALDIRRELHDRRGQAHILTNIGAALDMVGRVKMAIKGFHAALSLYREVQDDRGEAFTLLHLGVAYHGLEEREKALSCLEQALAKHRSAGNDVGCARTLMELGSVYVDGDPVAEHQQGQNSLETAMRYLQQALALQEKFGDRAWQGRTWSRIGEVYVKQGETAKALGAYLQALSLHQSVDYYAGLSATLGFLSNLFREAGKDIWAQDIANEAKSEHAHYAHLARIGLQTTVEVIGRSE